MKKILTTLLLALILQTAFSQEIIVKNLQGEDVDFNKIVQQSKKDQPTLVITWADTYCGVCRTIINELQNQYIPLKENYNLRVITLNTDSNKDGYFKKYYNRKFGDDKEPFTSITNYVKQDIGVQKWNFEKYVDEYFNFFNTAKLTGAPAIYIFYNGNAKFIRKGFWVPKDAKSSDSGEKLKQTVSTLTVDNLARILASMYANTAYLNKNKGFTIKEEATYKRTIVKIGDLYEITDSWITGEIQMKGTFKDMIGDIHHGKTVWYYKNGKLKISGNYYEGKKDSVWYYYDEKGNETNSELYERGLNVALEEKQPSKAVISKPSFKGGREAYVAYLTQNMKYPETARRAGVQGKVFVEFVVAKDGSIQKVKLLKGVHPDLDAEAIRLVQNMPKWNPGEQAGEKVNVKQTIPINFNLQ